MYDIVISLTLSIIVGGLIGFEREKKNRPAGMKTHILVCLGAVIISLIQRSLIVESLLYIQSHPEYYQVIRIDQARLTAQVVSGIGFLGAGTIIVTKQNVKGLTTAASLWVSAALGIAIGMGYHDVSVLGAIAVLFALSLIKKIIKVPKVNSLEVKYVHRKETKEYITHYFEKQNIEIDDVTFEVQVIDEVKYYKNTFTFDLPKLLTYTDIIEELSLFNNIVEIRLVRVTD